ncbi:hypothetical protein AURDEDRAFT_160789 [Auricularia subglabra TFB-10046 SS5]|nr:hypothetical protein AURDEDRAFT_160789 [Auricularia subglabra TFB-10046 SS5]
MEHLARRYDMLRGLLDAGMVWDSVNNAPAARLLHSVDGQLAADHQEFGHGNLRP